MATEADRYVRVCACGSAVRSIVLFRSYGGNQHGFGARLRPSLSTGAGTRSHEREHRLITDLESIQILPKVRLTVQADAPDSSSSATASRTPAASDDTVVSGTGSFMSGTQLKSKNERASSAAPGSTGWSRGGSRRAVKGSGGGSSSSSSATALLSGKSAPCQTPKPKQAQPDRQQQQQQQQGASRSRKRGPAVNKTAAAADSRAVKPPTKKTRATLGGSNRSKGKSSSGRSSNSGQQLQASRPAIKPSEQTSVFADRGNVQTPAPRTNVTARNNGSTSAVPAAVAAAAGGVRLQQKGRGPRTKNAREPARQ